MSLLDVNERYEMDVNAITFRLLYLAVLGTMLQLFFQPIGCVQRDAHITHSSF